MRLRRLKHNQILNLRKLLVEGNRWHHLSDSRIHHFNPNQMDGQQRLVQEVRPTIGLQRSPVDDARVESIRSHGYYLVHTSRFTICPTLRVIEARGRFSNLRTRDLRRQVNTGLCRSILLASVKRIHLHQSNFVILSH
jgi:hypothetical protein